VAELDSERRDWGGRGASELSGRIEPDGIADSMKFSAIFD
jgi:hypothetical protein